MTFLSSEFYKHGYLKITCITLALITIFLIMVWTRAFYGSMQAYKKGELHLAEHRYIKAVTFFDRSIHWYTPFNPYVEKSSERLWEIGLRAEQRGDIRLALIAYRTIRRGYYASSNFVMPGRTWIERCESKIDELTRVEEKIRKRDQDFESEKKLILQSQKTKSPDVFWSITLEVGFLGWVGSVICLIMFALRRKEGAKSVARMSLPWVGLALIFFALWIVGMMKA